jgi:hypothetical protein
MRTGDFGKMEEGVKEFLTTPPRIRKILLNDGMGCMTIECEEILMIIMMAQIQLLACGNISSNIVKIWVEIPMVILSDRSPLGATLDDATLMGVKNIIVTSRDIPMT